MDISKYRTYLTTGELYRVTQRRQVAVREETILLWIRNGHYHVDSYDFQIEFGNTKRLGGLIRLSPGKNGRFEFADALFDCVHTQFEGEGSLATPLSPRSEVTLEQHTVVLSPFDVGDKTGVELELAPYSANSGGMVELTEPQRVDLGTFLNAGNPEREMNFDSTKFILPDGSERCITSKSLWENPELFL